MSAVLLCLGVPEGCMFGIDLKCWTVGPKFEGICDVPTGPHFIYYSAVDKFGNMAVSSGMNLFLDAGQVWIGKWDSVAEQLVPIKDRDEGERFTQGVLNHDFDRGLGRYPREQFDTWYQLSCHISKSTLARLEPVDHVLFSSTLKHEDSDDPERTSTVFYTDINERFLPKDALPSEVTAINLDKTPILEHLIEKDFNGEPAELLGEMQFAFISFLLGQTYEGFEHWKRIVSLLCSCERGLTDFRKFFSNFIDVLQTQIEQAPEDFFVAELSSENFLNRSLSDLFALGEDTPLSVKLSGFRRKAENHSGWHFSSEPQLNAQGRFDSDDEDAPVIIELP